MSEFTPKTLREGLPFPVGEQPDEQLWLDAHADAWEEDVSDVCTINAELNTTIIRQQKRIEVLEGGRDWALRELALHGIHRDPDAALRGG